MHRTGLLFTVAALLAVSAGCSMCSHPHDYCGPTFDRGSDQSCDPIARAGSILSPPINGGGGDGGGCDSCETQPSYDEPIPAGQIISVTDEVVKPDQTSNRPDPKANSAQIAMRMLKR